MVAENFFEALLSLIESVLVGLTLAVEEIIDFCIEAFRERFPLRVQIIDPFGLLACNHAVASIEVISDEPEDLRPSNFVVFES